MGQVDDGRRLERIEKMAENGKWKRNKNKNKIQRFILLFICLPWCATSFFLSFRNPLDRPGILSRNE